MILDPRRQAVLWSESPAELLIYHATGWAPDGRTLSSCRSDRRRAASLVTWRVPPDRQLETGEIDLVGRIDCGMAEGSHDDLVWLPSGTMVATVGAPVIKVWRPENSAEQDLSGRALDTVRWSADGRQLAVRRHGQWALIDLDSPEDPPRQELSYPFGTPPLTDRRERAEAAGIAPAMYELRPVVEFAPSDAQHAVAFWFGAIEIFRTDGREPALVLEKPAPTRWASLCFTPDESRLVSLAEDRAYTTAEIIVWDLATGQRTATAQLSAQDFEVSCTADKLTASQHHVAVVTRSGLLGLYEIEGLRPVCWIKVNGPLRDASFDPGGDRLAVVGDAGLYLLRVPPRSRGGACST